MSFNALTGVTPCVGSSGFQPWNTIMSSDARHSIRCRDSDKSDRRLAERHCRHAWPAPSMAESAESASCRTCPRPIGIRVRPSSRRYRKEPSRDKLLHQLIAGHRAVRLLQQVYQHIIGHALPVGVADALEFLQSDLCDVPCEESDDGAQVGLCLEQLGLRLA